MSKLSLLSKNAYLTIYISENFVYSHLAYSHYDINRAYILKDVSRLPLSVENVDLNEFWSDFFLNLEKKWDWNIFLEHKSPGDMFVSYLQEFVDEGRGISGCSVKISKNNVNYTALFDSFRKFSLDFKITGVNKPYDKDTCKGVSSYLDYEDCLFLDLNTTLFKIYRFEKPEEDSKGLNSPDYIFTDGVYKWAENKDLLDMIKGNKYRAFLSKYLNPNFMANIWGNFMSYPILETNSEFLKDFVRAYITVQLLAIFNSKNAVCKDFGVKKTRNLVWLTGDLIALPDFRKLLISIIDGLQLKGNFDVCFDSDQTIYTFGRDFSKGVKSEHIIFTKDSFLPKFTKVFIPDMDLRTGERKVLLTGRLREIDQDRGVEVSIMSSELSLLKVSKSEKMIFEGYLTKKANIEHYAKDIEFNFFDEGILFQNIVFDSRFKPVVYGPGPKDNDLKFNVWLSSEYY